MARSVASVSATSHVDHVPAHVLAHVLAALARGEGEDRVLIPALAIVEVTLPRHLPAVPCALRGPSTGEPPVRAREAFYGVRGEGRPNLSRMTALPSTTSRVVVVVVVGLSAGEGGSFEGKLATVYGGPLAPQEPGDPYLDPTRVAASVDFWGEHALSVDGSPSTRTAPGATFATFAAPAASQAAAKALA